MAAVIPAFNEEETIGDLVDLVSKYAITIIVDDASNDNTAEIAKNRGAFVISHDINRGYEQALKTGFDYAEKMNCTQVVTLDADGQHDPHDIDIFRNHLDNGYDVVVGRRRKMQRLGEQLFATVTLIFWKIRDPLCGMKAYRIECTKLEKTKQEFDSVGTIFAVNAVLEGRKLINVDISTKERADVPRFGIGWQANKRIICALINILKFASQKE